VELKRWLDATCLPWNIHRLEDSASIVIQNSKACPILAGFDGILRKCIDVCPIRNWVELPQAVLMKESATRFRMYKITAIETVTPIGACLVKGVN
jgi:hypothetical protein